MSERGKFWEPVTGENAAVVLLDHQAALLSGVRDIPLGELKHNVVALARAATVLDIPLVVTTTAAAGYDAYVAVDASSTFSQAKREAGLLRMQQAGVIVGDYATLMVEALADNAAPRSGALYAALDMPFAVLAGQVSAAYRA